MVGALLAVVLSQPLGVPEFRLPDADGGFHTRSQWRDAKAVVVVFISTDCPVSNAYSPEYARLQERFANSGVLVFGVHGDPDVTAEQARLHAKEFGLKFPVLLDPEQILARSAQAGKTPEAVVLTPAGVVKYRGRIDDRWTKDGKRRDEAQSHDLRSAIEAVLAGRDPNPAITPVFGCPLPKPKLKQSEVAK